MTTEEILSSIDKAIKPPMSIEKAMEFLQEIVEGCEERLECILIEDQDSDNEDG